jgi:uncharacterized protein (UPF0276 family)
MISGLYKEIETLLARRRQMDATAANPGMEPSVQHSARLESALSARKMKSTMEAALENRLLIVKLQGILNDLTDSPHTSRHRSLVVTKLEEAQDRLRRELGPEETAEEI